MLSAYEYQVDYRKTQDHRNAECLSKLPAPAFRLETEAPGDVLLFEAAEYLPVTAADAACCTSRDSRRPEGRKWIVDGWPKEGLPKDYGEYEMRQKFRTNYPCIVIVLFGEAAGNP